MIEKLISGGYGSLSFIYYSSLFNYIETTNTKITPNIVELIQNYLKRTKTRIIELVS
jgi:hypothetical protein